MFHASNLNVCNIIFSSVDPDVLFAVSDHQTVRLSLADGSVMEFSGHSNQHFCGGHAMALNDDGTVLFIGYLFVRCVAAYDVATLQLMWRTNLSAYVCSIAYHDGLLLVAADDDSVTVLSAADGSVVRTLAHMDGCAYGISVFAGSISAADVCVSCIDVEEFTVPD